MKNSKKILAFTFKLILTLAIFSAILWGFQKKLGENTDLLTHLKNNLSNLSWNYLLLSIFTMIVASIFGALRIFFLTKSNQIYISYWKLFKNIFIGYLFNPLLMGSTGGDVIRSYYLTLETGRKAEVVTVVFLDRFVGISVLVSIAIISLLFNLDNEALYPVLRAVFILFAFLVSVGLIISSERVARRVAFIRDWIPSKKLKEIPAKTFRVLNSTKKNPSTIVIAALCTVLYQSLMIISYWLVSKSMASIPPIPLKHFFLFMPIIYTISAVPISLGGLGVSEAIAASLFLMVNVSEADSISISLLNRAVLLCGSFIGGIFYLLPSTAAIDVAERSEEKIDNTDNKLH